MWILKKQNLRVWIWITWPRMEWLCSFSWTRQWNLCKSTSSAVYQGPFQLPNCNNPLVCSHNIWTDQNLWLNFVILMQSAKCCSTDLRFICKRTEVSVLPWGRGVGCGRIVCYRNKQFRNTNDLPLSHINSSWYAGWGGLRVDLYLLPSSACTKTTSQHLSATTSWLLN